MTSDTAAVRAGEDLNAPALAAYLKDKIEAGAELTIEQFPGGHSNLTYLLRTPGREYVLRRGRWGQSLPRLTTWLASTGCSKPSIPGFRPRRKFSTYAKTLR